MKATTRETRRTPRMLALLAACALGPCALAQQSDFAGTASASTALAARGETLPRLEVSRSQFPRLEGLDSATSGPRLDLSVLSQRPSSVGVAFGMSGFSAPLPLPGQSPATTNFDLGVHLRHTTESNYQVDVTAWRRLTPQPDAYTLIQQHPPTYLARVELNLDGARSGFVADRGFLGMQLESGSRIGMRRWEGGAMIYYRRKF